MPFSETFIVNSHACDAEGIVRPTPMMVFMQECANRQLLRYGPSNDDLRKEGYFFVLSRMGMSFYAPLHAFDTVTAQTWSTDSHGFSFCRCHRLLRHEEVIAEAVSVWAMLRLDTGRPVRVSEYHPNYAPEPMLTYDLPMRIRIAPEHLKLIGEHTVRYSEVDINRHMNNTVYGDMLCNFLNMSARRVARINFNYLNEAPLGETIKVYCEEPERDTYVFRTLRSDGKINVEAEFVLEDLHETL